MLLSPPALKSLNSIDKIRLRLIIATFNDSPTNISDEYETTSFYDELSSRIRQVPKHNVLMIGYMNANNPGNKLMAKRQKLRENSIYKVYRKC